MDITTQEKIYKSIVDTMMNTYKKKNSDYGNSFYEMCDKFGYLAAIIPLNNKVNRLSTLVKNNGAKVNESMEDTLLDLANYAIMSLIYLHTNGKNKLIL